MIALESASFFNAVMATTAGVSNTAAGNAPLIGGQDVQEEADQANGAGGTESAAQLSTMTSASDLSAAARSFHERITDGLDPEKIPAPVQKAFGIIQASPSDSEAAGRAYFKAVEEVIGEQIVQAAFMMLSRGSSVAATALAEPSGAPPKANPQDAVQKATYDSVFEKAWEAGDDDSVLLDLLSNILAYLSEPANDTLSKLKSSMTGGRFTAREWIDMLNRLDEDERSQIEAERWNIQYRIVKRLQDKAGVQDFPVRRGDPIDYVFSKIMDRDRFIGELIYVETDKMPPDRVWRVKQRYLCGWRYVQKAVLLVAQPKKPW